MHFGSMQLIESMIADANQATSRLIINTFLELGLDALTSNKLAFINLTRDFLTGKLPLPFPPGNVALEILEDISDREAIAGMQVLAAQGYMLAAEQNAALVPFASIIKVDIRALDEAGLCAQVLELRRFPVQLLAENVETQAEFALCRSLGFDLFQGYFFSRPAVISGRELSAKSLDAARDSRPPADAGLQHEGTRGSHFVRHRHQLQAAEDHQFVVLRNDPQGGIDPARAGHSGPANAEKLGYRDQPVDAERQTRRTDHADSDARACANSWPHFGC